jgi:hypothetical protein
MRLAGYAGAEGVAYGSVRERPPPTHTQAAVGNLDLARAAWAFAHGMTIRELDRRFPPDADVDAAWRHGIDALRSADQAPAGARASSTAR